MRIFGLAGWSDSGKTTLMTALIPEFVSRGITVSTIKHAHHSFDIDQPGKDSWRHRQAGAQEVLVASAHRWALMRELRGAAEPSLDELLEKMSPVDLVLVEGFKRHPHPKIEVYRRVLGKPLLHPDDHLVVAIAADEPSPQFSVPFLPLADTSAIANFVLRHEGIVR
ncbi:MAG TPA: molybdopterin-guanine dinucleotide biosynthesis protein B [Stellaceae bacterium]|jgi:molybdopterin-guanine dinucleotide biosynthesis protein B|nr:molybdopterin-guanine dinucleotide biosynthesis protein B [Stellaceae bacterium]